MVSYVLMSNQAVQIISTLRLFIALELPQPVQASLADVQNDLRGQFPKESIRWIHPDDTHCTLKFLGNVSEKIVDDLKALLYGLARFQKAFQLQTNSLDCFPHRNKPNVVYAAVYGQLNALSQLQQQTDANVAALGFEPETRRYTPHLTLARIRRKTTATDRKQIGDICSEYWFEQLTWKADSVSLWHTHQTTDGPRYSIIESVSFNGS